MYIPILFAVTGISPRFQTNVFLAVLMAFLMGKVGYQDLKQTNEVLIKDLLY